MTSLLCAGAVLCGAAVQDACRSNKEMRAVDLSRFLQMDVSVKIARTMAQQSRKTSVADRIDLMKMLSTAEFEEFFGSAPDFVADLDDETWAHD